MNTPLQRLCEADGGLAFPSTMEIKGPCTDPWAGAFVPEGTVSRHVFLGMTLRDYFITHAPSWPPDWFNPVVPPCPAVPSVNAIADDELRHAVKRYWDGEDDTASSPAVLEWIDRRKDAVAAQEQWQIEFRKQRYVQWPAAWADEMLKARARTMLA